EQTLNQILVEMDGFEKSEGIIVLAATNRPDVLDPALLRPGRFDRQITVSMPDIKEREAILAVHVKKVPLAENVDISKLARGTSGMSGADLSNIVNEAAILAARKNKETVDGDDLEEARDKVLLGLPRKSLVLSEKNKLMTAYHEAGHALPYYFLKNVSDLHKVTIIPHERALGVTVGLPKEDSYTHTRGELEDRLVVMFGGYVAENLIYGETTTGTQNDIQQATELAHRMVCQWGMSKLGPICFNNDEEPVFMGKEFSRHKEVSDYAAEQIDRAIKEILIDAENRAKDILSKNREKLEILAKSLVEKETLDDNDIRDLLGFEKREII
ncbi:MAG: AAA family ATPase, partial [Treponemataceae bacterium]|nr:AAA family ATPase [Treponemataceae bacterium]